MEEYIYKLERCSYIKCRKHCKAYDSYNKVVGICSIDVSPYQWVIAEWFVYGDRKHNGMGKNMMGLLVKSICEEFPIPERIMYNWNHDNYYVYDWMRKHFDAESIVSPQVAKNNFDDDKESHMFRLNINKFFEYFNIRKER